MTLPGHGVPARGPGQSQVLPERASRIEGAEQTAVLEQRHRSVHEPFQVTAWLERGQVEAVDGLGLVPDGDELGEADGAAPVQEALRGVPGTAAAVAGLGRAFAVTEVDGERAEDSQRVGSAAGLGRGMAESGPEGAGLRRAGDPQECHVGVPGRGPAGGAPGGVHDPDRVALRGRGSTEGPVTENVLPR